MAKEQILKWTCPKCGTENTEYYPLPVNALCEQCGYYRDDNEVAACKS